MSQIIVQILMCTSGHHPQRSRLSIGGRGAGAAEATARMEAATLAGLAGNAAGPPGTRAVPSQSHRPAQQSGLSSPQEEAATVDALVPAAMPYALPLRREGKSVNDKTTSASSWCVA